MLFNSIEFLVFFPAVLILYTALRRHWTARKLLLLLSSYLFYMAWNPPFVLLLIFSTLLDYVAGGRIAASDRRSARVFWVTLSCVGNLGVLAFFKYGDFLLSNIWTIAPASAVYPKLIAELVLPIGISFYTFQSLSYTIDVFRDREAVSKSFLDFAVYVSFFPQLVAGPIIRSGNFLPQLKDNHSASADDVLRGIDQVARGFAKKIIVADTLATYVDIVYASPGEFGAVNHLLAVYAYAFQIYFDFSGYSDIAIGTAAILGFKVPQNFRLPYLAKGPSDFWTRWHISLSTWLRDYLYISLGGSRADRLRTYRNLLITMLLGGLWHGAAWGFILWGAFHGLWLVIHRLLFRDRKLFTVPGPVSLFFTFHLVCAGWVFFRAESLADILTIFAAFTDFETPVYQVPVDVLLLLALSFASHGLGASRNLAKLWSEAFFGIQAFWYCAVIVLMFLRFDGTEEFIYFAF